MMKNNYPSLVRPEPTGKKVYTINLNTEKIEQEFHVSFSDSLMSRGQYGNHKKSYIKSYDRLKVYFLRINIQLIEDIADRPVKCWSSEPTS